MKDSYKDHQLKKEDPKNWFRGHPIISDQINRDELGTVIGQLERVLQQGTPGAIVEFGCYIGTTSHFIRRVLDEAKQSDSREFHVYDSFEGLPEKGSQDSNAAGVDFEAGKLYVSKKEFMQLFRSSNLRPPIAHKGWFSEIPEVEVPEAIAFAFLDGDFYDSIIDSLRLVWPRMSEHGIIVIDDYKRETLPGVERAITDFFKDKRIHGLRGEHNKAIIEL
ncbi:MAG TPA: TylF/MycF/NovP-related O-methyltransferase [Candidatus Saccharimonadales bacterium]|nr:TylF/MycF/NovP-related O-methyltransferase [Candidatus Saccharimonadales bacterium]